MMPNGFLGIVTVAITMSAMLLSVAVSTATADYVRFVGLTQATLLSGSTLTACSGASVNTSGCSNGMAAVAYVQRKYEIANGRKPTVFPFIDRQTAFVQMYPATWAVNVPILERFGLDIATAPPSIFTSEERTSWEYFHNTSAFKLFLANVDMPASDKWYTSYLPFTIVEGVGIILVDSNTSPNTIDPYAVVDNLLSSFALRASVSATMVIFTDSLISGTTVYNSIGARKPTVIVPIVSSAASSFTLGTTLIVPMTLSSSTISFVRLTLDDTTGNVLAASVVLESLAIPIGTADKTHDLQHLDGCFGIDFDSSGFRVPKNSRQSSDWRNIWVTLQMSHNSNCVGQFVSDLTLHGAFWTIHEFMVSVSPKFRGNNVKAGLNCRPNKLV